MGCSRVNNCQDGRGKRDIWVCPTEADKCSLKMQALKKKMQAFRREVSASRVKATLHLPYQTLKTSLESVKIISQWLNTCQNKTCCLVKEDKKHPDTWQHEIHNIHPIKKIIRNVNTQENIIHNQEKLVNSVKTRNDWKMELAKKNFERSSW